MNDHILFVDDDPNVLATYQRNLRKQFQIETAASGDLGLQAIVERGPFAVIVSDLRMPEMDGLEFLARAKERSPDSILIMFTGYADLQAALDAVNQGVYFRFLIKPCPTETLAQALQASIAQYQLVIAERELLEKTLKGSVEVLTEILGMVNPLAFGRATRVKNYVVDIAAEIKLPNVWQLEVAAMLSQIGCVTVPPQVLEKAYAGELLTAEELESLSSHPAIAGKLVATIPRLEPVACMIEAQQAPFKSFAVEPSDAQEYQIAQGAQILKVALELDQLVYSGLSPHMALEEMRHLPDEYNPAIVDALGRSKGMTASLLAE